MSSTSIVTDLKVCISPTKDPPSNCGLDPPTWHRVETDLYLGTLEQSAWLYVALAEEEALRAEDLVVTGIRVGGPPPFSPTPWKSRPGGIWVQTSKFSGKTDQVVTAVDVLFGVDAVDPRPQWTLLESPLQLPAEPAVPAPRLTVLHGRIGSRPDARADLRIRENGTFKIIQFSDMHMVTGSGICKDAIDADGNRLPESEADPLTVKFMGEVLDDEGAHALSREEQMSILQKLPFSQCEPGPEQIDGIGNYYIQILGHAPAKDLLSTLYFLDSHGGIENHDYDFIKPDQIQWFKDVSETQRSAIKNDDKDKYMSMAFIHIPVPEFGDDSTLKIHSGCRREPTEGASVNSHFYDACLEEGISAICCGHDHANDFCAQRDKGLRLCYSGSCGWGGIWVVRQ